MGVLVFGKTGQVARELAGLLPDAVFLDRTSVDLAKPETIPEAIAAYAPDAVINAAAYTAVDQAEEDTALAMAVNGHAPTTMAQACASRGIPFLHVSTDYVFNGAGATPHKPTDLTGPLGAYGRTKLAGEEGVRAAGGPHLILRTSWVYSRHGANFLKTMLRVGATRDHLTVVADQIGGPTPAYAIAQALKRAQEVLRTSSECSGTYHFSGTPDASWADFARAIFKAANMTVTVEGIPSSDWPTPAPRPLNSRLDCTSLETVFGIQRPDWEAGLVHLINEVRT